MIYLDHNGTTPLIGEVRRAMQPFLYDEFGNPSSKTPLGRKAHDAVETARAQVASALGARPGEIVFTSGGTESNNSVVLGLGARFKGRKKHIVTTAVEHPAIIEPCIEWMNRGGEVSFVPVDETGRVDPDAIMAAVGPETFLVTVMHANNETGTLMPVAEIGRQCRERGILFHTDAAQSVGKVSARVDELCVDFLSVAGHKLYAPKGVGALYVREGIEMPRFMFGAAQETGRRAGTENVIFDVALGAACEAAARELDRLPPRLREWRDRLQSLLEEQVPGLRIFGHPEYRLPNTLFMGFPEVAGEEVLAAAPEIFASTGAACHSDQVKLSHVLAAMGVSREQGKGAVRLTLGRLTTEGQIGVAAEMLVSAYHSALRKAGKR
ncbi:MAG: cysteine desulfurase [Deltaproteobacteria bacterium]|nr:cysteine desulfurase [Deltaproteobacteria bacterium]